MNRRLAPATYALALATISCGAANYTLAGLLTGLSDRFHVSVADVGQLGVAFGLTSGITALIVGVLTAHWPRRRVLVIGLALSCAGNIAAALASSYPMLDAARIITGFGCSTAMVAAIGQAAELNAPGHRARALAVAIGGLTLALAVAPPAAAAVAAHEGAPLVFAILAWFAALALGIALIALPATSPAAGQRANLASRLRVVTTPGVPTTLLGKLAAAGAAFAVQTYLTTLTSPASAVVQLAAYGAGAVGGTQLGGRLADHWAPKTTAITAILVQASVFAAWPLLGHSAVALVGAAFVSGLAFWAAQPAVGRRLADLAREHSASALALDSTVIYLGQAAGALIGALQPPVIRPVSLPVTCSVLSVVAVAILVFSGKNPPAPRVSITPRPTATDKTSPMGRPRLGRTDSIEAPVTPETKQQFKNYCDALGRSMTDVVNDLIAAELKRQARAKKRTHATRPSHAPKRINPNQQELEVLLKKAS